MPFGAIGAAVLGGAASAGIGLFGAGRAEDAAEEAAGLQGGLLGAQYNVLRSDLAPYREAGTSALSQLTGLLGLPTTTKTDVQSQIDALAPELEEARKVASGIIQANKPWEIEAIGRHVQLQKEMQDLQDQLRKAPETAPSVSSEELLKQDPSYQFRLEEGGKVLAGTQAGRRLGGRAAKEALRYGQDYASTEYQNVVSRLAALAGGGQAAATQTAAGATGGQIANVYGQLGQTQAGLQMGRAGILAGAATGTLENVLALQEYNRLYGQGRPGTPGIGPESQYQVNYGLY